MLHLHFMVNVLMAILVFSLYVALDSTFCTLNLEVFALLKPTRTFSAGFKHTSLSVA